MLRLGAAEQRAERDAGRAHDAVPTPGGSPDGSGGGGGGGAEDRRRVLGAVRGAVLGPRRELVGGRPARAGQQRAHLVEAGVDEVLGVVDPPLGRRAGGRPRARPGA